MTLIFSEHAWADYRYWQRSDKRVVKRINPPIQAISREPFAGIGKPEPLRHGLSGYWSRRIDEQHRIVYKIADDSLLITQPRCHY
ncbi:MAG: Txe/YoeB family addiction module toxin [Candidatus Thiodiazotropha sp. (ex Dulcina madagascariensis)]|nr:Txe/YoeB family addiction module toxin [Candidatus Thiodiazotropha sp. (ex Dulcina madagascariensis)]